MPPRVLHVTHACHAFEMDAKYSMLFIINIKAASAAFCSLSCRISRSLAACHDLDHILLQANEYHRNQLSTVATK